LHGHRPVSILRRNDHCGRQVRSGGARCHDRPTRRPARGANREGRIGRVKLDWMMLANYAEVNNGLLYIAGGSCDTTTIHAPLPSQSPEGAVAIIQGFLVVRELFHVTETD